MVHGRRRYPLKKRRASFTLEAAIVIPVVIFIMITLIQMGFYRYQLGYYAMAAREAALWGIYEDAGDATRVNHRWQERMAACPIGCSGLSVRTSASGSATALSLSGSVRGMWPVGNLPFHISVNRRSCNPAVTLRRVKEIKNLLKE